MLAMVAIAVIAGFGMVAKADEECFVMRAGDSCGSVVPLWIVQAESDAWHKRDGVINAWINSYRAGVQLPVRTDDILVIQSINRFLDSDEAKRYDVMEADDDVVYRDNDDAFYVNGKHIELPEFQEMGINADFVGRGSMVTLSEAVWGQ